MISNNERGFLQSAIANQVLRFGEFTLKSGRISPYFFNAGLFNTGQSIKQLGEYYAHLIVSSKIEFDVLFGPAYKGIPLATATAIALSTHYQLDVPVCYNRKEIKDHGEGGKLVGAALRGRILIIDDVISAGTAIRESIEMIKQHEASLSGIAIALDRQEKGLHDHSASQEITVSYGIPVISIADLDSLIEYVKQSDDPHISQYMQAIKHYRSEYGCEATS